MIIESFKIISEAALGSLCFCSLRCRARNSSWKLCLDRKFVYLFSNVHCSSGICATVFWLNRGTVSRTNLSLRGAFKKRWFPCTWHLKSCFMNRKFKALYEFWVKEAFWIFPARYQNQYFMLLRAYVSRLLRLRAVDEISIEIENETKRKRFVIQEARFPVSSSTVCLSNKNLSWHRLLLNLLCSRIGYNQRATTIQNVNSTQEFFPKESVGNVARLSSHIIEKVTRASRQPSASRFDPKQKRLLA